MIPLGCLLLVCAWLWSSGVEVPGLPGTARMLWLAGTVVLFAAYLRAGRRLPARLRLARSAAWAAVTGLLSAALGFASGPILDWLGPYLAMGTAPASVLAAAGRVAGLDVIAQPAQIVVQDMAAVPAHATSWEQLELPAAIVLIVVYGLATACRARGWARGLAVTSLCVAAWLPARFLLASRLLDDLGWMGVHWHPIAVATGLLPAIWLASRISPLRSMVRLPVGLPRPAWVRWALATSGIAVLAYGAMSLPAGRPGAGRILVDDAHSDWEWTNIPFDRTTYTRQTTYSYYSLLDFLAHHYQVTANTDDDLTDALLADADVLILKTPTRPYLESERDAIVRFVEAGGGLLLISDHTNLFGMTTYINPIGEPFGVQFMMDDTFDLTSGHPSSYAPPRLGAHPAVVHMPKLEFETSCSLKPSPFLRPIISGRGLGSEPVDYAHVNFFGNITAEPNERWGVLLQAASTSRGRGRIAAFTDSTIWSNFSVFFQGKPELALGLVEFLNRRPDRWTALRYGIPASGILLLAAAIGPALRRRPRGQASAPNRRPKGLRAAGMRGIAVAAAVAAGVWAGGALATRSNAASYPLRPPAAPMVVVAFDKQHSDFRLPTLLEASVPDPQRCFDTFFVTTQRIHLFPRVAADLGHATQGSRVVVVLNATTSPSADELSSLYGWVRAGGRLLIMEPATGVHLAANRFLEPAGMRISAAFGGQDDVPTTSGLAIYGGRPQRLWREPDAPLVSVVEAGAGRVVAVLGSERFSFQTMGPAFNAPNQTQKAVYERVYELFQKAVLPEGWSEDCPLVRRHTRG